MRLFPNLLLPSFSSRLSNVCRSRLWDQLSMRTFGGLLSSADSLCRPPLSQAHHASGKLFGFSNLGTTQSRISILTMRLRDANNKRPPTAQRLVETWSGAPSTKVSVKSQMSLMNLPLPLSFAAPSGCGRCCPFSIIRFTIRCPI
ncbi:uncharacterized protein BDW47DRAFT_109934 [Aspergillus candidus]|uniref:Uncharacterized protein n=1 Tax=Aspergillus candidus TaxID=41067 RepID=A0A2I2F4S9_ASPCN|nr:hypothetical protein BDW47DRAFT_109934 [Aspergillus candidus]PLB35659.1 hypothetical protein BDW47DRAFT_109934 [Aspergillus candidus]